MKLTPSSTTRRRVAMACALFGGSPQIPGPVIRMAPNPSLFTVRSPPMSIVPAAAAVGCAFTPAPPPRSTPASDAPLRPAHRGTPHPRTAAATGGRASAAKRLKDLDPLLAECDGPAARGLAHQLNSVLARNGLVGHLDEEFSAIAHIDRCAQHSREDHPYITGSGAADGDRELPAVVPGPSGRDLYRGRGRRVRRPAGQPQRRAGQHGDRKYAFHIPPAC